MIALGLLVYCASVTTPSTLGVNVGVNALLLRSMANYTDSASGQVRTSKYTRFQFSFKQYKWRPAHFGVSFALIDAKSRRKWSAAR